MHRSGTSMVAGVLARLGANMGCEFMPPNRGNPTGYYENMDFVRLNREILGHKNNSVLPIPSYQEIIKQKDKFVDQIRDLVKKSQSLVWGWKDPRTSLTIELFLPFVSNPYFIICQRSPLAIAKSLKKRDRFELKTGLKVNAAYNQAILYFLQKYPAYPRLFVFYEQMVDNPLKNIEKIAEFIDLPVSSAQIKQAAEFVLSPWGKRKVKWGYYLKMLTKI